jgi:hypothetical protein
MRGVADSILIGIFALRLLQGQVLRRITEITFISLFSLSILAGCSTQSTKTVETDKTIHYTAETDPGQSRPMLTEERSSKTEETKKDDGPSFGLLSGSVHVVGEALALPFRAVAGLINLAF